MVVRKIFTEQLNDLHQHLMEMGMLANEAIFKAVKSLVHRDTELAKQVVAEDKAINNMELSLEQRSLSRSLCNSQLVWICEKSSQY